MIFPTSEPHYNILLYSMSWSLDYFALLSDKNRLLAQRISSLINDVSPAEKMLLSAICSQSSLFHQKIKLYHKLLYEKYIPSQERITAYSSLLNITVPELAYEQTMRYFLNNFIKNISNDIKPKDHSLKIKDITYLDSKINHKYFAREPHRKQEEEKSKWKHGLKYFDVMNDRQKQLREAKISDSYKQQTNVKIEELD